MAEPFDTIGASFADVIDRLAKGEITEEQAGDALSPLLAATNDGEFGARVAEIVGVVGRITGLLMVEAPPSNLLGAPGSYAWDRVNKVFYGPKDAVTGWPAGDSMTEGPPGPELELQKSATHVQWRVVGAPSWTNLIALADLNGADGVDGSNGTDGREVALRATGTHIQWRLEPAGEWVDLIALADLKGADGSDGADGSNGADGADGREVQLQTSATHIQWRYAGETAWTDLLARSTLKGDPGDAGSAAWTPVFATVADGERRVQRIVDWTGGDGAKPATGKYVGPTGLVDTAAEATDVRGAGGSGSGDMLAANNLSDLTDKGAARTTLSVYSKAEADDLLDDKQDALGFMPADASNTYTKAQVDTALGGKQASLGFTPEDASKKGEANGYAALGSDGKVPAAQLPAYPVMPGIATVADVWAGTDTGKIVPAKVLLDALAPQALSIVSGVVTPDFNLGINFGLLVTANITLANPLNENMSGTAIKPGRTGGIGLRIDGTGSRTISFGSRWRHLKSAGAATLPTAANAYCTLYYECRADAVYYGIQEFQPS